MITYLNTDIFSSPAKALINAVNTEGVMGKGIAKQFKTLFPDMFAEYQRRCESGELDIGKLHLFRTSNKWVLNFPTKKRWRNPSKKEYIEAGLKWLSDNYIKYRIYSISFPLIGCGNGELDWNDTVRPMMERYLNHLSMEVYIHIGHKPDYKIEHKNIKETEEWLRSEPESLAFSEVWSDLQYYLKDPNELTAKGNKPFRVDFNDDPKGMTVHRNDGSFFAHYDELLNIWQELRETGIMSVSKLPGELDREYEYIFAIFLKLPYMQEIKVSTKKDLKTSPQTKAIMYRSRPSKEQLELIKF